MPRTPTSSEIHLADPPKNRQHLHSWLTTALGLTIPDTPTCPCHNAPLDYLAHAFFEPADQPADAAVWACRGGGKTMLGAVATLLDLLFKPGIQIRILGGSLEQSDKMYTYLKDLFNENFPESLRRPPTRRRLVLKNGSIAEILAQSDRSVRGTRVQKLRCDEVELFDPNVWKAAQLTTRSLPLTQLPPVRGSIEALSTMHIPNGLMQKLLQESSQNPPPPNTQSSVLSTQSSPPPRKTFTWCLWDVIAQCPDTYQCNTCPLWSDCQGRAKSANGFLPVPDAISMHARVSRPTWEHEMLCHPPVLENAVFPAFRRSLHVRPWPLPRQAHTSEQLILPDRSLSAETLIAGIDFGYKGPFVCLWIQMLRDPQGRRVAWVLDEYLAQQRTLPTNITAIKSRPASPPHIAPGSPGVTSPTAKQHPSNPSSPISHLSFNIRHSTPPWHPSILYCDPAGRTTNSHTARTDESLLRAAGFKVQSRSTGISDGIALLTELLDPASESVSEDEAVSLTQRSPLASVPPPEPSPISHLSFNIRHSPAPRLLVDPRCTHLITALENYHHLPSGEIHKDNIHDHPIDALRYALLNHDTRPTKLETRNY